MDDLVIWDKGNSVTGPRFYVSRSDGIASFLYSNFTEYTDIGAVQADLQVEMQMGRLD